MKRLILLAAALGSLLAAAPASAQPYGGGYGYGPGPGYDDEYRPRRRRDWDDEYDRPRRRDRDYDDRRGGFDGPRGGRGGGAPGGRPAGGNTCVTPRGNCPAVPGMGPSCACTVPGTGEVRGSVR